MGKVLAIIFLFVFAWFAVPKIAQAQWFAPTLYPNYWWGQPVYNYPPQVAQRGAGWFSFIWGGQPSFSAGYTPGWGSSYYNQPYYNYNTAPYQLPYHSGYNSAPYYAPSYNGYYAY